ncbi:MAG: collagen-like protein [Acidimicrobiia bacterium]
MRSVSLFVALAHKVGRHSKVVALSVAALVVGVLVVPGQLPAGPALSVRLMSATHVAQANGGYWLVSSDGTVTAFGTARLYGSMAGQHLTAPIIGIVATKDGHGYWLVAKDGGVFSFGDATFAGSLGSKFAAASIVGMASNSGPGSAAAGARGPQGVMGPVGHAGKNGPRGLTGAIGDKGPAGSQGSAGINGTTGGTGATGNNGSNGGIGGTGLTGGTGPQGPASGTNYGYIYNAGAQTVPLNTAVDFDTNGTLFGFVHAPGSPAIEALVTGTYRVSFSVSGVQPNEFALFVNGVIVPGSIYGSGAGTQQNNGEVILSLNAADTVTLVNNTSASAVTLQTLAGGTQTNVNAAIVIEQLG